jgi:hypothetical protein
VPACFDPHRKINGNAGLFVVQGKEGAGAVRVCRGGILGRRNKDNAEVRREELGVCSEGTGAN